MVFIFPLCVLLVFLTLAAQYESWSLPLAIILIVPMCLLSAITGIWLRHMDNNSHFGDNWARFDHFC
jgi:multidrug efflux pump